MAKIPIKIPTYINSAQYAAAKVLPRIFFYNGNLDCETYNIKDANNNNVPITYFPYFDNYNVVSGSFPTTDSTSLLFNNESPAYGAVPTDTLYSNYWETYVELLYNPRTRLLNASAIIPLADYFKMNLNDIVEFRGNYYHLRAINDYNLQNGECSIQLLGPIIPDALTPAQCGFDFVASQVTTTTTSTTTTTTSTTTTTTAGPTTTTTTLAPPVGNYNYYAVASNCCSNTPSEAIIGVVAVTASIGGLIDGNTIGSNTWTGSNGIHCVSVKYTTSSFAPLLFVIEESQANSNIYGLNQCNSCNRDFVPNPPAGICLDMSLINAEATIKYINCSNTEVTYSMYGGTYQFCSKTSPNVEYTSSKGAARLSLDCDYCGTY